jgi:hypothetical protein
MATPPEKEEGLAVARPAASKASKAEKAVDQKACDALVKKILKLDDQLARTEGEGVTTLIEKGQHLIDLKAKAMRTWVKRLGEMKLNPRVASRLIAIGTWGREIGPIESDLLAKLPQDVHKLEWIVQLAPGPLQELVADLDCRAVPRATVIRTVKGILGQGSPTAEPDDPKTALKAIEKIVNRLVDRIEGLETAYTDGKARGRGLEILDAAVDRLRPQPVHDRS